MRRGVRESVDEPVEASPRINPSRFLDEGGMDGRVVLVYTYIISRRTQITFSDRQHALLVHEANRTGISMAELVRRSVDRTYRPFARPTVRGFEFSMALWRELDAAVVGRRVRPRVRRLDDDAF